MGGENALQLAKRGEERIEDAGREQPERNEKVDAKPRVSMRDGFNQSQAAQSEDSNNYSSIR